VTPKGMWWVGSKESTSTEGNKTSERPK